MVTARHELLMGHTLTSDVCKQHTSTPYRHMSTLVGQSHRNHVPLISAIATFARGVTRAAYQMEARPVTELQLKIS